jgi:alpha-tubulin suppressor-like RCC1 family protein
MAPMMLGVRSMRPASFALLVLLSACSQILGVEDRSFGGNGGSGGEGGAGGDDGCDLLLCDGACVDPLTSAEHCGWCGRACPGGEACSGGVCDRHIGDSAGAYTSCLRVGGELLCFGAGDWGQLGDGVAAGASFLPTRVDVLPEEFVARYAVADKTTCALEQSGEVRCFGDATQGATGTGVENGPDDANGVPDCCYVTEAAPPVDLPGPARELMQGGSLDRRRSYCALLDDLRVFCWGRGPGDRTLPSQRAADILQMQPAQGWSCGVASDRTVGCWGLPVAGYPSDVNVDTYSSPVTLEGLEGVAWIGGGRATMCARRFDGEILCWGENQHGELGPGHVVGVAQYPPQPLAQEFQDDEVVAIRGTGAALCALLRSGDVYCWGWKPHLGIGQDDDDVLVEAQQVPIADVVELSGTNDFMVARTRSGIFYRWGVCTGCDEPAEILLP